MTIPVESIEHKFAATVLQEVRELRSEVESARAAGGALPPLTIAEWERVEELRRETGCLYVLRECDGILRPAGLPDDLVNAGGGKAGLA